MIMSSIYHIASNCITRLSFSYKEDGRSCLENLLILMLLLPMTLTQIVPVIAEGEVNRIKNRLMSEISNNSHLANLTIQLQIAEGASLQQIAEEGSGSKIMLRSHGIG